ncbi:hypothetical protein [Allorhizocola rhizosphaerae]|uniref:hypothetical protein n=1 Tax=Allorhizocola rhizosphaerae TaxID=1872709 RepID=UPI0013C35580|nr:hypothetical protein [Allorhizocola rhizosphaerae]
MPGGPGQDSNLVHIATTATGLPASLVIRPEAMRLTPQRLAEVILSALRGAHETAVQELLARFDDARIDPHTPSIRQARETAAQIQADVRRQTEQVRAELDALRSRLPEG